MTSSTQVSWDERFQRLEVIAEAFIQLQSDDPSIDWDKATSLARSKFLEYRRQLFGDLTKELKDDVDAGKISELESTRLRKGMGELNIQLVQMHEKSLAKWAKLPEDELVLNVRKESESEIRGIVKSLLDDLSSSHPSFESTNPQERAHKLEAQNAELLEEVKASESRVLTLQQRVLELEQERDVNNLAHSRLEKDLRDALKISQDAKTNLQQSLLSAETRIAQLERDVLHEQTEKATQRSEFDTTIANLEREKASQRSEFSTAISNLQKEKATQLLNHNALLARWKVLGNIGAKTQFRWWEVPKRIYGFGQMNILNMTINIDAINAGNAAVHEGDIYVAMTMHRLNLIPSRLTKDQFKKKIVDYFNLPTGNMFNKHILHFEKVHELVNFTGTLRYCRSWTSLSRAPKKDITFTELDKEWKKLLGGIPEVVRYERDPSQKNLSVANQKIRGNNEFKRIYKEMKRIKEDIVFLHRLS